MRIITLNANGIRAAVRKGLVPWLLAHDPDVLCLQETKAHEHQVPEELALPGYTRAFVDAQKKGYSGVAIFAKREPLRVVRGLGAGFEDMDLEGRFLRFDYPRLRVVSLYVPSGTSGPARQAVKESFLERFFTILQTLRVDGVPTIVCGDWNIAHREIDVYDPVRNARVTGFLPQERAWFDRVIAELGWIDAMRVVDPNPQRYTWWSGWPQAFPNNLGWRIDYQLVTPDLAGAVRAAAIERDFRFSDHAPLTIDYDLSLDENGSPGCHPVGSDARETRAMEDATMHTVICPDCHELHDEPLDARLGIFVRCEMCALEAERHELAAQEAPEIILEPAA